MRGRILALVRHLAWEKNWRKDLSGCRSPSYGHEDKGPATRELFCLSTFIPSSFANSLASNLHSKKCTRFIGLCVSGVVIDHHNLTLRHCQPGKG